ncbi:MAG TPA: hypothetical protein VIF60_11795 [Burkholderiaceae bacterium]
MTTNIYSAPAANLDEAPLSRWGEGKAAPKFYVVGPLKFWLLFVCTLGFYKVYWFYKNWSRYKAYTDEQMWPVPRGIFSIFFVHSLFRLVDRTIEKEGRDYSWNAELTATMFVVFQLTNVVLDKFSGDFEHYVSWIELLIMVPVLGTVLFNAQRAINAACGDPDGESNSRFGVFNYFWLTVGTIFWLLVLIGLTLSRKFQ